MARYALETLPDPSADEALRDAWLTEDVEWTIFVDGPGLLPVVTSQTPMPTVGIPSTCKLPSPGLSS